MFRKISSAAADADAHSFSSLASPFTRPPKPTPLNSRNSTSLLQMFRKISPAAAYAHSFSSPFTRPRKPTPLTSRNSTSLLQMFRKISPAAADTHSFSSLASPFTLPPKPTPLNSTYSTSLLQMFRKISPAAAYAHSFSSLAYPFTRPPKPTPLNSRNSTSLFTYAENSHYEPKIEVSTARLREFLQTNCKSGDVTADEAFGFFRRMVQMEPRFRLYSFNLLLNGLAKNKRYYDVLSLFGKMNSGGLTPNFITLNILLKSSCNANRVCDAFLVMGRILRKGYSPTIVTFDCLIKGLCMASRIDDAVQLYLRLEKFGCRPDVITWRALRHRLRLCRLRYTSNARTVLELLEEKVDRNYQYCKRCRQNGFRYVISSLCKKGKEDKAMELFIEMQGQEFSPDMGVYDSIKNGLHYAGKWKDTVRLLEVMVDREIHLDGKTFYVFIDLLSYGGDTKEFKSLLDWIIEYGIDLMSKPVNMYDGLKAGEIEEAT